MSASSAEAAALRVANFEQAEIEEIRECFRLFAHDGRARSAAQLRLMLRSLGYAPTRAATAEYFRKYGEQKEAIDLAVFLAIVHEERESGDPREEVSDALRTLEQAGALDYRELRAVLGRVGERLSAEECDAALIELVDHRSGLIQSRAILDSCRN